MLKTCSVCKIEKTIDNFSRRSDRKSGLQSRCKQCFVIYRKNNLESERITKAIYRTKNAENINKYHIEYNSSRDDGLYSKWISMNGRLKSNKDEYSYKSRGIINEWSNYTEFKNDMYNSYLIHLKEYGRKQTSLDRIDNGGNYSKENCRWADWKIQNNNKRKYRKETKPRGQKILP